MYTRFWGFREKPFRQVPNPDFLFLSPTHEEALAHLHYALAEGEGFLMITGEVGTGKSTLCRTFLQKLDPDTACAYIFNPKLDPLQLLKSINAEFGIAAEAAAPQDLVDHLNAFLIEQKASGRKVVLVIDEAQNLPVESLEQVRLLSNLETTRDKLLHIVLVGQPELADRIEAFDLRQLGQRIQLACHLRPLTFDETVQYIHHRINQVSQKPQMPFDKGALRAVYAFSKGVPRLINTACDRLLLAGCLKERKLISRGTAKKIIEELQSRGRLRRRRNPFYRVSMAAAVIAAVMVTGLILYNDYTPHLSAEIPATSETISESPTIIETASPPLELSTPGSLPTELPSTSMEGTMTSTASTAIAAIPTVSLEAYMASFQTGDTRGSAFESALRQWGLVLHGDMALDGVDDAAYFELVAARHGLSIQPVEGDLKLLGILDLPAVIMLHEPGTDILCYASLVGMDEDRFILGLPGLDRRARVDEPTLKRLWGGKAYVPWKNYMGYDGVIPGGAPRAAVVLLKQLLWEIGYPHLVIDDRYDEAARYAVREIQAKHGLAVDGLVGNMTKIVLFNEKTSLPIPRLSRWSAADDETG